MSVITTTLTPHELRVAELAAAGKFNREIADEFKISVRGVEFHLTNVYRKLGVTRRIQLVAILASAGALTAGNRNAAGIHGAA